jgi:hypothetical protein
MYRSATAFVVLILVGCEPSSSNKTVPVAFVESPLSLISVIADLAHYNGKVVKVDGLYRVGFEMSGFFPSRDMSYSNANGVWLNMNKGVTIEPEHYFDLPRPGEMECWAFVEGVVDATSHGHLGAFTAGINVSKLRVYPVGWLDGRTRMPNQLPDPTSGPVTPPARAGAAPSPSADH